MERKIGEIFEYNGEWYQCVESDGTCNGCVGTFQSYSFCNDFEECVGKIFKKIEKVGEPYEFDGHLFQSYRTFEVPIFTENYSTVRELGNNSKISIEIKQNKENMEENYKAEDTLLTRLVGRYVNNLIDYETFEKAVKELYSDKKDSKPILKEFDLEAAEAGKPVCTRDGRKAIFLTTLSNKNFPVVAIVCCGQEENVYQYDINGVCDEHDNNLDLMMLPEKKEGWVNLYREEDGTIETSMIRDSYDDAKNSISSSRNYIDTIKIQWEE